MLEGRKRLTLGRGISIGDGVRIRSRVESATIRIGDGVKLREFVEVNAKGGAVEIGSHAFIGKDAWLGGLGAISIGANVMVGIRAILVSSDHDYHNIGVPYYDGSELPKPIVVGDNVWIGANAVVLGGTEIGAGSVVAAGAVVHGSFPPDSLLAGVPATMKSQIVR